MIRPLSIIGMIVIAIALFSYLLIPGWRSSPMGIGVLILCLGIGGYALVKDMRDFWKEISSQHKPGQPDLPDSNSDEKKTE